jgi:hypothetical protein
MGEPEPERIRVLAIHGAYESGKKFRIGLANVERALGDNVSFSLPDGVYLYSPSEDSLPGRFTWTIPADGQFTGDFVGLHRTFSFILNELIRAAAEGTPYTGIIGFSEGANVTALICALMFNPSLSMPAEFSPSDARFRDQIYTPLKDLVEVESEFSQLIAQAREVIPKTLQFAIFACGGFFVESNGPDDDSRIPCKDDRVDAIFKERIVGLATMHIFGSIDPWVSNKQSRGLASYFEDSVVLRHSAGHFIPGDPASIASIREFILANGKVNSGLTA